jgi:hypothetical protein
VAASILQELDGLVRERLGEPAVGELKGVLRELMDLAV